jgi:hypothetical protein
MVTDVMNNLSNSQLEKLIDEWVRGERNRKIMKRRLIDCICFEPLAEEFELSVRQVKNIVYKENENILKGYEKTTFFSQLI